MRRSGIINVFQNILFCIGLILCFYPTISSFFYKPSMEEEKIAILKISKINLELPIYEGTEEETLQKGVGHIWGSSLPIGGDSTHSLLAGHRGLLDAPLFTRLNELKIGDEFIILVHDKRLVYKVCEIRVIKPENTEGLGVQKGRDLVSLITCTPYGINTHRLIVTGERKETE